MIFHSAFEAAGYVLLEKTNNRYLGEFPTWEKDGVRIALYRESLMLHRGEVLRQPADGNEVTLHGIIVDLKDRLKGKANAAMRLLLDEADHHGVTIYIEPAPMVRGGMNRSQLVAFYGKRGFVGTDATNNVMRYLPGAGQLHQNYNATVIDGRAQWFSAGALGRGPFAIDRPGVSVPELAGA